MHLESLHSGFQQGLGPAPPALPLRLPQGLPHSPTGPGDKYTPRVLRTQHKNITLSLSSLLSIYPKASLRIRPQVSAWPSLPSGPKTFTSWPLASRARHEHSLLRGAHLWPQTYPGSPLPSPCHKCATACHASFQDIPSTTGLPPVSPGPGTFLHLVTLDPLPGSWPSAGHPPAPSKSLPDTPAPNRGHSSPFPCALGAHGPFPTPTRESRHSCAGQAPFQHRLLTPHAHSCRTNSLTHSAPHRTFWHTGPNS